MESYFVMRCPGCKTRASIAITNLNKKVSCLRCEASFIATDPAATSAAVDDPMQYWINFTDRTAQENAVDQNEPQVFRAPR